VLHGLFRRGKAETLNRCIRIANCVYGIVQTRLASAVGRLRDKQNRATIPRRHVAQKINAEIERVKNRRPLITVVQVRNRSCCGVCIVGEILCDSRFAVEADYGDKMPHIADDGSAPRLS